MFVEWINKQGHNNILYILQGDNMIYDKGTTIWISFLTNYLLWGLTLRITSLYFRIFICKEKLIIYFGKPLVSNKCWFLSFLSRCLIFGANVSMIWDGFKWKEQCVEQTFNNVFPKNNSCGFCLCLVTGYKEQKGTFFSDWEPK